MSKKKSSKRKKIKKSYVVASVIGINLAVGIIILSFLSSGNIDLGNSFKTGSKNKKKENLYEMPLSGNMVKSESLTKNTPFVIIIENSPHARPQSGLDRADLVYEMVTEGGITRYLAIYQQHDLNEIGPVRSARTYFVDWTASYGAILAHFGGSEAGLNRLLRTGVKNINGMYESTVYWRDRTRNAPHNAYSSISRLKKRSEAKGYILSESKVKYQFKEDLEKENRPESQKINVNFSTGIYKAAWEYDKQKNIYLRYLAGQPHLDRVTGRQLTAKNIVIQEIVSMPVLNTEQRGKNTLGMGKATFFRDGQKINAIWKRKVLSEFTRFYDPEGKELKFNRGQTWFQVIDQNGSFQIF